MNKPPHQKATSGKKIRRPTAASRSPSRSFAVPIPAGVDRGATHVNPGQEAMEYMPTPPPRTLTRPLFVSSWLPPLPSGWGIVLDTTTRVDYEARFLLLRINLYFSSAQNFRHISFTSVSNFNNHLENQAEDAGRVDQKSTEINCHIFCRPVAASFGIGVLKIRCLGFVLGHKTGIWTFDH